MIYISDYTSIEHGFRLYFSAHDSKHFTHGNKTSNDLNILNKIPNAPSNILLSISKTKQL